MIWVVLGWGVGCSGTEEPSEPAPTAHVVLREELKPVAIATRDLPAGHVVTEADVRQESLPPEVVPPSALPSASEVVGRTVPAGIWANQPFIAARLDTSQAFVLKPGMSDRELDLGPLTPLAQHGDIVDVVHRRREGPCLAAVDLFVTSASESVARVAAPTERLTALDAVPVADRVVLLRGFRSVVPPLDLCGQGT